MKKTRAKNIFRGIRGSLNRFLSILFIVALGSGFMAGLAATSPDMYATADRYMDEYNWYDLDIKSTLGFSNDDLLAIRAENGIVYAQGARVVDTVLKASDDEAYTSRVFGILDKNGNTVINRARLKEGRMPENDDECVIQPVSGRYFAGNLKIGDELSVSADGARSDRLKIVGFVESPMCISLISEPSSVGTGKITLDIYVHTDFFEYDYFTDVFVMLEGAKALDTFGDEYSCLSSDHSEALKQLADGRLAIRETELKNGIETQIEQLEAVRNALGEAVAAGSALSKDTVTRLKENAVVISAISQSDPALAKLLGDTQTAVYDALKSTEPPDESGIKKLDDAIAVLREKITEIDGGAWLVRTRDDSAGYSSYDSNVGKVAALSKIFPVFFFMVALLVALTTMTRLVEENRTQIGTLKALGFSNVEILGEYMFYSLLSSALGCILGFSVGFRLFPKAISSAYAMMFTLPEVTTSVRHDIVLWVAPVTVGSILLATLWACWSEFRACPAKLMQPKAPAAGKRIWLEHLPFIWKRLSFTHKVTCRNLFRYKKRFFMTVIGVAGCSALLVTGFGLRDSINDIVNKQFGEIYLYQMNVLTDGEMLSDDLVKYLDDKEVFDGWLPYSDESGKVMANGKSESANIEVPSDVSDFGSFISLRNRKTKEKLTLSDDGAVLTEKLCETLGVTVGDSVTLQNSDGREAEMKVIGITENYLTSFAYVAPGGYANAFGKSADFRYLLCRVGNAATDAVSEKLLGFDNVLYVNASQSLKDNFADSIKSIDGVIFVLILSAGLLCMVVLYNLTNVNICERRKELATIRVLGFHPGEVSRYIFRETDALSLIGSAAGLFAGIWLHSFVVRTVEVDQVMFGRSIYPLSFVFALAISLLFTFIVDLIMRKQIRSVDMVEAMKSND
ncbi:MAG: ABC transporter permease [Ruminococcus sp.]|nr:ABC transporter permease [Ruminococcus sp.]